MRFVMERRSSFSINSAKITARTGSASITMNPDWHMLVYKARAKSPVNSSQRTAKMTRSLLFPLRRWPRLRSGWSIWSNNVCHASWRKTFLLWQIQKSSPTRSLKRLWRLVGRITAPASSTVCWLTSVGVRSKQDWSCGMRIYTMFGALLRKLLLKRCGSILNIRESQN